MTDDQGTTLRLNFPQWQGGDNPAYTFGSRMLDWLAPAATGPIVDVPVPESDGTPQPVENGIPGRSAVLEQQRIARQLIDEHAPDRLVVFGGDCLVDHAPFAYLSERYGDDWGILWVDAHSDVLRKEHYPPAHGALMGVALGHGEPDFVKAFARPIDPRNVMFAGRLPLLESLPEALAYENELFERLQLRSAGPEELAESSEPVLDWIRSAGIRHLSIHLDLDVLDPTRFRSLLFANPDPDIPEIVGAPLGQMRMEQLTRLFADVNGATDIVGMTLAEHLPWDSMALSSMLHKLPLIGSPTR